MIHHMYVLTPEYVCINLVQYNCMYLRKRQALQSNYPYYHLKHNRSLPTTQLRTISITTTPPLYLLVQCKYVCTSTTHLLSNPVFVWKHMIHSRGESEIAECAKSMLCQIHGVLDNMNFLDWGIPIRLLLSPLYIVPIWLSVN